MATYLISSPSINQLKEELNKIFLDKEYEILNNDTNIKDLLVELSYTSLFSSERNILIKDTDYFSTNKLDKTTQEVLEDYLKNDSNSSTIVFTTSEKVDERKKITKLIKSNNHLIICPKLTIKEIFSIIKDKIMQNKYTISDETLYYLINSCNNEYDLVINELNKIYIYYQKPCEILLSDLKEIISTPLENNNFKLIEAIVHHDIKQAFKIYNDLKLLKVEPLIIINLLAREYRLTYLTTLLKSEKLSVFEIAKKLNLQPWQVNNYLDNSSLYTQKELIAKIKELANIDYQIKSGKLNKHLALEVFILKNA